MSKKGIKQAFKESQYTPSFLKKQSLTLLSQDYTRQRDIMQKRYKRLKKQGFRTNFTNAVEKWGEIPKLSTIKKEAGDELQQRKEIGYWLATLKMYETEETTVKYQKTKVKEYSSALKEAGYEVTKESFNLFTEFMDYTRSTGVDALMYSTTYNPNSRGYRDRQTRTDGEKTLVNRLFDLYRKNNKSLPLEELRRSL